MEESRLDELDLVAVKVQMPDAGVGRRKLLLREVLQEVLRQVEPADDGRKLRRDPSEVQTAAVDVILELRATREDAISQR